MRCILTLFLLPITCLTAFGQTLWSLTERIEDGKSIFGVVLSDGSWLIEPKYDHIQFTSRHSNYVQNFFFVEKEGKMGLVNHQGKLIVPLAYDWVELSNHFILVSNNGKSGAYSYGGKKLLDPIYEHLSISNFGNHFTLNPQDQYIGFGREGAFGVVDTSGNVVIPPKYDGVFKKNGFFETRKNGAVRLFNVAGEEIDASKYSDFEGDPYYHSNRGYLKVKTDGKWGIIDSLGNTVLPTIYSEVYFGQPYIFIKNQSFNGLALYTGEIVLDPMYSNIFADERKRFFIYGKDGKHGMLNRQGEKLLPMEYDEIRITRFHIGLKKDNKYGLCDSTGKLILDTKYDYIDPPYKSPVILFVNDGKHGAADRTGREIIPAEYDRMNIQRKWIYANKNEKSSGFTYNGEVIYSNAESMRTIGGLFFTLKNGLWSAVDSTGKQRIAPNYTDIGHSMSFGPLPAQKNGKWGYINEKGETVIPFKYDQANSFNQKGYAHVTKDGVKFFINTENKRITVEPDPVPVASFEEENYDPPAPIDMGYRQRKQLRKLPKLSSITEGDRIGFQRGETTVLPTEYDEIILSELNIVLARKGSNWSVFDTTGALIFDLNDTKPSTFLPLEQHRTNYPALVHARYTAAAEEPEFVIYQEGHIQFWKRKSALIRKQAEERGYFLSENTYQKVYFPGGHQKMLDFIQQEMKYPKKAKKRNENAVVYVQAIIEKDGSISIVSVINDEYPPYFTSEAKRIVRSFPKLTAAQMEDLGSVRSELVIPIVFDCRKP